MSVGNGTVQIILIYVGVSIGFFSVGLFQKSASAQSVLIGLAFFLVYSPLPGIIAFRYGMIKKSPVRPLVLGGIIPLLFGTISVVESTLAGTPILIQFNPLVLPASGGFAMMGFAGSLWSGSGNFGRHFRTRTVRYFRSVSVGLGIMGLVIWYLALWVSVFSRLG